MKSVNIKRFIHLSGKNNTQALIVVCWGNVTGSLLTTLQRHIPFMMSV